MKKAEAAAQAGVRAARCVRIGCRSSTPTARTTSRRTFARRRTRSSTRRLATHAGGVRRRLTPPSCRASRRRSRRTRSRPFRSLPGFPHRAGRRRAARAQTRRHELRRERPAVRRRDDATTPSRHKDFLGRSACSKTPTATAGSTRAPSSPTSSPGRRRVDLLRRRRVRRRGAGHLLPQGHRRRRQGRRAARPSSPASAARTCRGCSTASAGASTTASTARPALNGGTRPAAGRARLAEALDLSGRDFSFDPRRSTCAPRAAAAQHGTDLRRLGPQVRLLQQRPHPDGHVRGPLRRAQPARSPPRRPAREHRRRRAAGEGLPHQPRRAVADRPHAAARRRASCRARSKAAASPPATSPARPASRSTAATPSRRSTAARRSSATSAATSSTARCSSPTASASSQARRRGEASSSPRPTTGSAPCQFANAPDGTLYVLDMYREVIEHPASLPPEIKKHLDLTSGRDRGRIYRVVPEGFKQRPPPQAGEATTTEHWSRRWSTATAGTATRRRGCSTSGRTQAAVPPLEKLATTSKLPEARMHALYVLAGLGRLSPSTVLLPALATTTRASASTRCGWRSAARRAARELSGGAARAGRRRRRRACGTSSRSRSAGRRAGAAPGRALARLLSATAATRGSGWR